MKYSVLKQKIDLCLVCFNKIKCGTNGTFMTFLKVYFDCVWICCYLSKHFWNWNIVFIFASGLLIHIFRIFCCQSNWIPRNINVNAAVLYSLTTVFDAFPRKTRIMSRLFDDYRLKTCSIVQNFTGIISFWLVAIRKKLRVCNLVNADLTLNAGFVQQFFFLQHKLKP